MTDRINISVFFPGVNNSYDFSAPSNMSVKNVVDLMVKIISEEFPGIANDRTRHSLIKRENGIMLNETFSLQQLGITDGEKLVMI